MTSTHPRVTRVAIALGVAGSMAGNVTWAWTRSPVLVGVGIGMSVVLPVAIRLWGASAGVTGWARIERAGVMTLICGGAALYTLVHSSSLLHEQGLPWVIAWVPATVMELLVVQATRAGGAVTPPKTAVPARSAKPKPSAPRRDAPADVTMPPALPAVDVTTSAAPSADDAPVGETPAQRKTRMARERKRDSRAKKAAEQSQRDREEVTA